MSNERAVYWITLASQNLRMAGKNTNDEKRTRCGHAQETAETALKAAIEAENLNPAWSHDLEKLRNELPNGWGS